MNAGHTILFRVCQPSKILYAWCVLIQLCSEFDFPHLTYSKVHGVYATQRTSFPTTIIINFKF